MPSSAPTEDLAYCRAVLPQVSRTFALNIRLLRGRMGTAVQVGYLLCRAADAIEDSWTGDAAAIVGRFERLERAMAGDQGAAESLGREASSAAEGRPDLELLAHLPRVWRAYQSLDPAAREPLAACVRTMAQGMSGYASRAAGRPAGTPYLDTEAELHDYCWIVAGCVGVMLTRLFEVERPAAGPGIAARRLELAPTVGEALQLTNILLDWPVDVRRGRCYVPAAWLAEQGLEPGDLVGADRPGVRVLAARLERLARAAIARVPDYLDTLPGDALRYRLFVLWAARWGLASLDRARRDPTFPWGVTRPKLSRARLWGEALAALAAPNGAMLRRAVAGPRP
jgi:farnesyl-diphosphate farnesyltransferase